MKPVSYPTNQEPFQPTEEYLRLSEFLHEAAAQRNHQHHESRAQITELLRQSEELLEHTENILMKSTPTEA
jgi:hypothetical protein